MNGGHIAFGNEPEGDAQIRYNIRFYIFALLFILLGVSFQLSAGFVFAIRLFITTFADFRTVWGPFFLAGIPPLGGFVGKVSLFYAAMYITDPVKMVLLLTGVGIFWLGILPGTVMNVITEISRRDKTS